MTGFPIPTPVLQLRTPATPESVSPRLCDCDWRSSSPATTLVGWGEFNGLVALALAVT